MTHLLTSPLNALVSGFSGIGPAACLGATLVLAGCNASETAAPATPDMATPDTAVEAATSAGEAATPTLSRSIDINASAADVWSLIGPYCSLTDWHPMVGSCSVNDETPPVRTIVTADGSATFIERETARDDGTYSYSYAILSGPLPVSDYVGTIAVVEMIPGVATVTWSSTYTAVEGEDDAAAAALTGIYMAGLAGIAARMTF